jgi:hypothetical protein
MNHELRSVFVANGELHAQQVRAFLEATGIHSSERGEALRHTHGLTLNGLGTVEIMVDENDEARARMLLASADAGAFRIS